MASEAVATEFMKRVLGEHEEILLIVPNNVNAQKITSPARFITEWVGLQPQQVYQDPRLFVRYKVDGHSWNIWRKGNEDMASRLVEKAEELDGTGVKPLALGSYEFALDFVAGLYDGKIPVFKRPDRPTYIEDPREIGLRALVDELEQGISRHEIFKLDKRGKRFHIVPFVKDQNDVVLVTLQGPMPYTYKVNGYALDGESEYYRKLLKDVAPAVLESVEENPAEQDLIVPMQELLTDGEIAATIRKGVLTFVNEVTRADIRDEVNAAYERALPLFKTPHYLAAAILNREIFYEHLRDTDTPVLMRSEVRLKALAEMTEGLLKKMRLKTIGVDPDIRSIEGDAEASHFVRGKGGATEGEILNVDIVQKGKSMRVNKRENFMPISLGFPVIQSVEEASSVKQN